MNPADYSQARCPVCNVPLDAVTPHIAGCEYLKAFHENIRGMSMSEYLGNYIHVYIRLFFKNLSGECRFPLYPVV